MSTPVLGEEIRVAAPPPLDEGWDGLEMWVVDRNGRRWDVSSPASGVFFMPGVTGMSMPKLSHQTLTYANANGNTWNGLIIDAREVFWPTYLYSDADTAGYLGQIRDWWDALNPWHTVRWFVRDSSGSVRWLDVRLLDDGGAGNEIDDTYMGWSKHRISLQAAQPMWRGDVVERPFVRAAGVPFHGPGGLGGPPFRPSRNSRADSAEIENEGDSPEHLVWRLVGPLNPSTLGFGDYRIDVPFVLNEGQELIIDTNPEVLTAMRDGVEVTHLMTGRFDVAPIPPKAVTQLVVSLGGDGAAYASITPSFLRAYA